MSAQPCGCDLEAGWLCDQHTALLADTGTSPEPNTERLDGKLPKWERLDRAERFKARLAAADQMQDTTASRPGPSELFKAVDEHMRAVACQPSPAEQFRAEAVATAARYATDEEVKASADRVFEKHGSLLKRLAGSDVTPIEESLIDVQRHLDYANQELQLLAARVEAEQARIAAILARFYYAEHSLSSMQPIIALALELNPDLVERAR